MQWHIDDAPRVGRPPGYGGAKIIFVPREVPKFFTPPDPQARVYSRHQKAQAREASQVVTYIRRNQKSTPRPGFAIVVFLFCDTQKKNVGYARFQNSRPAHGLYYKTGCGKI